MTKKFIKRIIKEGIVDTKKYRYVLQENIHTMELEIQRIKIEYLDTDKAYKKEYWETVKKNMHTMELEVRRIKIENEKRNENAKNKI